MDIRTDIDTDINMNTVTDKDKLRKLSSCGSCQDYNDTIAGCQTAENDDSTWIDREIAEIISELIAHGRFAEEAEYIQHGTTSVYSHSINVAMISMHIAMKLAAVNIDTDKRSLIRGALLHDYFLYDWHVPDAGHDMHGFMHPYTALRNAETDYELNDIERNIIKRHMFPLTPIPPTTIEGWAVCIADKITATEETFAPFLAYLNNVSRMPGTAYTYIASAFGRAA